MRLVTVAEVTPAALGFPYACTALRIERESTEKKTGKVTLESSLLISSLPVHALSPTQWQRLAQGHWSVESANHYRRDVSWNEDRELGRNARRACNLALLRSALLGALLGNGKANLRAVQQYFQKHPNAAIQWLRARAPKLPLGL